MSSHRYIAVEQAGRWLFVALLLSVISAAVLTIGSTSPANALPSFARQTGQPCGTCHTDFPALTPYGRRFKLLGYTAGGGKFRTTPFSSEAGRAARAELDKLRGYVKALPQESQAAVDSKEWVPPISFMAIEGYTHTQGPTIPSPADPYKTNDNIVASPVSVFWGGAITDHVGAFAQVTYAGATPLSSYSGTPADQFIHSWGWDNTDVRYANTASTGPFDFVYGITANNNPTVQDLWNTTPAWGFPYAASTLAAGPPGTMIEGAFAAHAGGVGAYTMINDLLYLEITGYKSIGFHALNALGANPFDTPGQLGGVAPYWRVALEPHWGRHTLMVGTFGMYFDVHPWFDTTFAAGSTAVLPVSDKFTDVGFDTQYQYQGDNFWLTLRGSYIREFQRLDASFAALGAAANPTNQLNSMKLQASLALGTDNRIVLTGQYFNVWGTSDAGLYGTDPLTGLAMTPNTDGWTAEIAYIPFGAGKMVGWPWFNARIGLQYTYYSKFNGATLGAHDNNTLFLHAWVAM